MLRVFIIALALSATTDARALFVGSDFELTITGRDATPPYPFGFPIGPGYEVYITNVSSQTAIFQENIFQRGASYAFTLNGENAFASVYFDFFFADLSPFPYDLSLAPGETGYFGGLVMGFSMGIPNPSTVVFESLSFTFSNNSFDDIPPDGDQRFTVNYTGPPVSTSIVTPIPAAGYLLLPPLLALARVTNRKQ